MCLAVHEWSECKWKMVQFAVDYSCIVLDSDNDSSDLNSESDYFYYHALSFVLGVRTAVSHCVERTVTKHRISAERSQFISCYSLNVISHVFR